MKKRILTAMSGGVDSSVAAYLIKSQGEDCVGVTLKLFSNEDIHLDLDKTCCSLTDVEDARSVATRLGMEHYVFNFSDNFKEKVIDRFVATYEAGGTPNPCIDCNRFIKWRQLLTRADLMECTHIATGHYARVEWDSASGRMLLKRSADMSKDQTYVLWALTQEQLSRTILPLGALSKDEVREIAEAQGFINANKPDSQDICFVPDGDYAGFIERYSKKIPEPGNFIDSDGKILGKHKGLIRYTIGQRKGLGIALGRPIFVSRIDPENNTVTLGDEELLFSRELYAEDINLIAVPKIDAPLRVTAKVRYSAKEALATVVQTGEDELHFEFDSPQRALTRGQSVVLYSDEVVIGGGIIK
ncbi:MAG: tRNA 2-thiouridine(34) synthase MnmA [Clostridia bacterium]|nr:tRNA 2-thiouridine(34) synthase MnmA [Clostridia bacterium]